MNSNENFKSKLKNLRDDINKVTGIEARKFVCPILYIDDNVELCRGHIINQSIPGSSSKWTIQRKDVDSFFGSYFESDFTAIFKKEKINSFDALKDKTLSQKLHPTITINGERIEHFFGQDNIPPFSTPITIENNNEEISINLKLAPEDVKNRLNDNWEIAYHTDLRISAIVTLIKSAHLTMFDMLGYQYAMSRGGYYVGKEILGNFFLNNQGKNKNDIINDGKNYFALYQNMVRPIFSTQYNYQGTITDNTLLFCQDPGETPWGFLIFIRTGNFLHCVLLPHLDDNKKIKKFSEFLQNSRDEIEVKFCIFENKEWRVNPNSTIIKWPRSSVKYLS